MKQATCEERINDHLESRLEHIEALNTLSRWFEDEIDDEVLELAKEADLDIDKDTDVYDVSERAMVAQTELPLSYERATIHKIQLSTGGPGDWIEIECSGENEHFDRNDVVEVTYHFNDWFDHAETSLNGSQEEIMLDFAESVIGY